MPSCIIGTRHHVMQPIVLGERWFGSKKEVLKDLKRVRETGPCPRELTDAEMSWILPLVFKHPLAPLALYGWDGSPLRVDIRQSYGGRYVRCFKLMVARANAFAALSTTPRLYSWPIP